MKIVKYKKGAKGIYKVELDDGRSLSLYEDVILKFNLLLRKEILEEELDSVNDYNLECDVYWVALNAIKIRAKSIYELKEYLNRKEYPTALVDLAVSKLIKQGYLDDKIFARSYINNQIMATNKGPLKIERELLNKKVSKEYILSEMKVFTDSLQQEKINKLIIRSMKNNHTRGGMVLKKKIIDDLKALGYSDNLINYIISEYSFENDSVIAKKEYDKLYRKYSRKYSGDELKYKIREKMYLKGLKYEENM